MKKKTIVVLMILCVLLLAVFVGCKKESGTEGFEFVLNGDGQSYTLAGLSATDDYDSNIVIPSKYNKKPVTVIGFQAFKSVAKMTEVTISDSVTTIADEAFASCLTLKTVNFSTGLKTIGSRAFSYCTALEKIEIPASVTTLGTSVFVGCTELKDLTVSAGNAVYAGQNNCIIEKSSKTLLFVGDNFTIPTDGSVAKIGKYVFENSDVTQVTIPNGITHIGERAFAYCSQLVSVEIADSVAYIEQRAFYNCGMLAEVSLGTGILNIGQNAFEGCTALQFEENAGVKYLGNEGNPNLAAVAASSTSVRQINLMSGTKVVCANAFENCTMLASIDFNDEIVAICEGAFLNCSNITAVVVPQSVVSIGLGAFSGCSRLAEITLPFAGATKDGVTNKHLGYIFGAVNYADNAANVPNALVAVTLTGGETIGDYAFSNCSKLTDIELSSDTTFIGVFAFQNCTSLRFITIPQDVQHIGHSAFSGSGITGVEFENPGETWCLTLVESEWKNKTGGETLDDIENGLDLYDQERNALLLKGDYNSGTGFSGRYWYKQG